MENLTQTQKDSITGILSDLSGVSVDKITEDTRITDGLGMDSLDLVEVIITLEKEFDCNIPDEDYEFCQTVADVFKIVANRIQ